MSFRIGFYISLCFVLASCSSIVTKNTPDNTIDKIAFSSDLKASLKGYVAQPIVSSFDLKKVYDANNFTPYWVNEQMELSDVGITFSNMLFHSMNYGLDTLRYNVLNLRGKINDLEENKTDITAIKLDVFLTEQYFQFSSDISIGIIDTSSYHPEFGSRKILVDLSGNLYNSYKEGNVIEKMLALQPQRAEYKNLQVGLENFLSKHALVDSSVKVSPYKKTSTEEDSIEVYRQAKEALVLHDYLASNLVVNSLFLKGLQAFQINHGLEPDMKVGNNTAKALSGNPTEFYKRAAIALEKWKWADKWENEYIYANIATYKLKFYKDEKLQQEHRTVVGKFLNQTPEIDSEMEYIVAYPFWTVPYSIKTKELVPKSKKDSNYLANHNYQLLKGGKIVDMASVNWDNVTVDNFDYTVRQKGGRSNALGVIKFIFKNKHSVYFHDTPSKGNFKNDIRAYSHGCVRVQEPLKIAEYLLAREGEIFSIDTVKALIKRRQRKTITLQHNMPVHIRYVTAEGDEEGNIRFYPDVYKAEKELEQVMFSNQEELES